jgi:hypothetical protein
MNCENNCLLDFKAKPFKRPLYWIILNLTLIYPSFISLLTDDGYDGRCCGLKESGQGPWRERKMARSKTQSTWKLNHPSKCWMTKPSQALVVHLMFAICVVVPHLQKMALSKHETHRKNNFAQYTSCLDEHTLWEIMSATTKLPYN